MSKNNRERRRAASEGLSIKVPAASSPKPGSTSIDNIPPQPTQDIVVRGSRKPTQRTEPRHVPNGDERRQLRVYSNKENKYTEINVSVVRDLEECWISEETVKRLELKRRDNDTGNTEWGTLGLQSVEFRGTTTLQWLWKSHCQGTKCRIVSSNLFEIYVPSSLLSPPSPLQRAMTSPVLVSTSASDVSADPTSSSVATSSSSQYTGQFDGDDRDDREELSDNSKEAKRADEFISEMKKIHCRTGPSYVRERRIRIAVLDTGVDSTHPFIKAAIKHNRIKRVESFVEGVKGTHDSHGHGTHIAALLLEIAPDSQLYIAKVAEGGKIPANHKIADAIRWAVKCGVDIITMSFGIDIDHPEMQTEINDAYGKKIIIFAAASNKGHNHPVPYPARRSSEVLCIYATDGYGNPYDGNPSELETSGYHFATLGIAVKSKWPEQKRKPADQKDVAVDQKGEHPERSGDRRKTGTSYATPIAAGIAAYVLDFALVNGIDDRHYQMLRTRNGMEKIFAERLVGPGKKGGLDYIHPWELFAERRTDELIISLIQDTLGGWIGTVGQRNNGELSD